MHIAIKYDSQNSKTKDSIVFILFYSINLVSTWEQLFLHLIVVNYGIIGVKTPPPIRLTQIIPY